MLPHRLLLPAVLLILAAPVAAADLPKISKVELQPLAAQAERVADALEFIGSPLSETERNALKAAAKDKAKGVETIQTILDKHCLAGVRMTPAGGTDPTKTAPILEIQPGPAKPELAEQGWRVFLVKVDNPAGINKLELRADSPNAMPMQERSPGSRESPKVTSMGEVGKRFLDLMMFNNQPLALDLSGLELEYRILQIYCRDAGRKEASLGFSLWRDTGKKGAPWVKVVESKQAPVLFDSAPAVNVKLRVQDHDGKAVMGAFTFRDKLGRVYPSQSRRLAPDFFFHAQVYRTDGESVHLQPGKYTVAYTRGPEYVLLQKEITVPQAASHTESFKLQRWVHPAAKGWWSGDHHIHAAGCAHYDSPTEGVTPEDMMRHILGEDLNVGCCLSWGPCWYHQKRYFEGKVHPLSTPTHILRYDVEVSGFPSSPNGHICLLRLKQQDYPGTKLINDWPSWDLPIFKWAKAQGGVVGFAHSGSGLAPERREDQDTRELPNYFIPRMDGIGANEYIMDIAHGMCDFISTVDTQSVWELNIWYHTLNCGFRCRISGETDFPCIYGERVGVGRSYVHLGPKLNFDDWCEGIKNGRSYVSDGKSHLMDFEINGTGVGLKNSEVKLKEAGTVKVKAKVAALLEKEPTKETERIRTSPLTVKPYWDLERSRVGKTRKVPVELVVNGHAVDKKEIAADGSEQEVTFDVPIQKSSWVCLRVFPSSHTNPVFVLVNDKPIRASKKSAEWCIAALNRCWEKKEPIIGQLKSKEVQAQEQKEAKAAYDEAREIYKKILAECEKD